MNQLIERLQQGRTLLFVAGGLGVLTALLVFVALSGSEELPPQVVREVGRDEVEEQVAIQGDMVVVAREAIVAGTPLIAALLAVVEFAPGRTPAGSFTTLDELEGRVTRFEIVASEQVLENRLVSIEAGGRSGLAFSIPPGLRAFAVPIENSLAGLVVPGDRIDVLMTTTQATLRGPGELPGPDDLPDDTPIVYTYMQDVFVLGIGTDFTRPQEAEAQQDDLRAVGAAARSTGSIILALTPRQAQQLMFASGEGLLSLTLRRFGDHSEVVLSPEFRVTPPGSSAVTDPTATR